MATKLIIIRGLPGSGKSTLAKQLQEKDPTLVHIEADMFFIGSDGEYRFNPKQIPAAHRWCFENTHNYLAAGTSVIVSNTFTQYWEMERYLRAAKSCSATVIVLTVLTQFQNTHGVPAEKVEEMRSRWEQIPDDLILLQSEGVNVRTQILNLEKL